MSGPYPYTRDDLLAGSPFHYHYTPFEGPALLGAYSRDRARALLRLGTLADAVPAQGASLGTVESRDGVPPFAGVLGRAVETAAELAHAAAWVAAGGDPGHRDLVTLTNELVRKFEISKRLRSRYGEGLRVDVRDSAPVEAYCHLSYLVARQLGEGRRLWRLNALLKLNDLVISTETDTLSSGAARSALEAIRLERTEVLALAQDKGVEVP